MEHNKVLRNSQLVGGEAVRYFTSVVEDLNSQPMWTNPATGVTSTLGLFDYRFISLTGQSRCLFMQALFKKNIAKHTASFFSLIFPY